MSITDELREWGYGFCGDTHDVVTAIADRIDAEHESKVSYWQSASYKDGYDEGFASADDWLAQHEDAMAEHGWIRLPKDADGVPIRIGDEMVLQHEVTEKPYTVQSLTWDGEDWYFTCDEGFFNACGWEHYHAPTVEDVLTEFGIDWEHESDCEDRAALLKEYAARLRLAGSDAE